MVRTSRTGELSGVQAWGSPTPALLGDWARSKEAGDTRHLAPLFGRGSYRSSSRSSHVSTGHLDAPPNTSTLLSTQGMTLPGMSLEQLAMAAISRARRTRSQRLNWLSSPTNACVASNLPPTVSCERQQRCQARPLQLLTSLGWAHSLGALGTLGTRPPSILILLMASADFRGSFA